MTTIDFTYSTPDQTRFRRNAIRLIETVTGQPYLKRLYDEFSGQGVKGDFFEAALEELEINFSYDREMLAKVPKTGPVLFIANHPYGVIDGLALAALARKARTDVKVMANSVLCRAPEAAAHLLPVDFAGTEEALKTNIQTRKAALQGLKDGGAVGIFPGGGVAASHQPFWGRAADPEWHSFLARLIQKTGATVVPIYFDGQNSRIFQIASHFSYTLRLALFFHETRRMVGRDLRVVVGEPITYDQMNRTADKRDLVQGLRRTTFALSKTLKTRHYNPDFADQSFQYPARLKI